jgi:hypothetical protein
MLAASATPAADGATMKVAICATIPSYDAEVQAKLNGTGLFSAVDVYDCHSSTPSLATFQGYGAVLAYSDTSFENPGALAQNLKDYIDGGGRLVAATFDFDDTSIYFQGTVLDTGGYLPFTLSGQFQGDGPLSLVADDSSSPLLAGVASFNGGTSSYRSLSSLADGATQVAHWSDGPSTPLVAFKGNVVGLNFYPPSSDSSSDFWDASTDGVQLLVNALTVTNLQSVHDGRAGYCTVAGNTDASGNAIAPGTFVDLGVAQPASDPHYKGALPANYYQGKGISCDNLPGYTKTTELVGYGGHGDPGAYTYYTKNA